MFAANFRVAVAGLGLAATALAQVSFTTVSGSIVARAGNNTKSATTGSVSASDSDPFTGNSATANASSGTSSTGAFTAVRATSTIGPGSFVGMSGNGDARLVARMAAAPPAARTLKVAVYPMFFSTVDIGNDGAGEGDGAVVPVVADSRGFEIKLGASASALAPVVPGAAGGASVSTGAASAQLQTDLPECGASMAAWITPHSSFGTLHVRMHSTVQASGTFLVVGLNKLNVSIPPLGCTLGTDLVIVLPVPVAANGDASAAIALPAPAGGTVLMQFLVGLVDPSGNEVWRTSNRLSIGL